MIQAIALTETGLQRDTNEDAFWVFDARQLDASGIARWGALYLVADGMGGHQAGEVASGMAATLIPQAFYADRDPDRRAALARAIQSTNVEIWQLAQRESARAKMGTTLVAALVQSRQVTVAHAGDSRAYLWRDGQLRQLTEDHTWVNARYREGILSAEEAAQHPLRHIVTRSLGEKPQLELSLETHLAKPGDVLLLCSDGLSGVIPEAQLVHYLRTFPPEQVAPALIQAANAAGGPDNITVVIVSLSQTPAVVRSVAAQATAMPLGTSRARVALAVFVAGILLLCLAGWLASRSTLQAVVGRLFSSASATAIPLTLTPSATTTLFPTPTPRPTPVVLTPLPYYGTSFAWVPGGISGTELLSRFDLSPLELLSWSLSELPLFGNSSSTMQCWAPRAPYGIVFIGEIAGEKGVIPQEFVVGEAYHVMLDKPLPVSGFEPAELRDTGIWQARIWGHFLSPKEVLAWRIELQTERDQEWHLVVDNFPSHSTQWFYAQQQTWDSLALSVHGCANFQDWVIAYLQLNDGELVVLDSHCLRDVICAAP